MNFNSVYIEKYAYIRVSIHSLLLPWTFSITISLQIAMLIIVVFEKKRKEKPVVTLWRLQYFCCTLHTTLFYTVVHRFKRAVVFVLYLCFTLIYIYCYSQYSILGKMQYRTILSVLCTRLLFTKITFLNLENFSLDFLMWFTCTYGIHLPKQYTLIHLIFLLFLLVSI